MSSVLPKSLVSKPRYGIALLLFFFILCLGTAQAQKNIVWKHSKSLTLNTTQTGASSLKELLHALLQKHATHPENIRFDPQINTLISPQVFKASSPETLFFLLLSQHQLSLAFQKNKFLILPTTELWKYIPYQKLLLSPLPLSQILSDLSQVGKITLRFADTDSALLKSTLISENLHYVSVQEGFLDLAARYNAKVSVQADAHTLLWTFRQPSGFLHLRLTQKNTTQIQKFLRSLPQDLLRSDEIKLSYPDAHLILLQGPTALTKILYEVLQEYDQAPESPNALAAVSSTFTLPSLPKNLRRTLVLRYLPKENIPHILRTIRSDLPQEALHVSWDNQSVSQTLSQIPLTLMLSGDRELVNSAAETFLELDDAYRPKESLDASLDVTTSAPKWIRIPIKYLNVGKRKFWSNGVERKFPGIETHLKQALDAMFDPASTSGSISARPIVIPDPITNALMIQGDPRQRKMLQEMIQLWDQPQAMIRIEAHVFETTDQFSRKLGFEFTAQGVPTENKGGTKPFSIRGVLGGAATRSTALQVDTTLRLMQTEGKGRVLSRPVVVTLNNLEAEMNSGSVIHVKLGGTDTTKLEKINTGITLRVTPHLITLQDNESTNKRIFLDIQAITSAPVIGNSVDGIPTINTQRVQSKVIVQNGEPVLLGGMIRKQMDNSESGIPFLKDLPLLGVLFRTNAKGNRFDHVLIFVTPTLIPLNSTQTLPQFQNMEQEAKNLMNSKGE